MQTMDERIQSRGEELANSLSHGAALLAAIAAAPFLIGAASRFGAAHVVGSSVFAVTMIVLYLTSTLYHALPQSRGKRVFQRLDHSAIYLFIAGSYTPFALGALGGPWGCSVWSGRWRPWASYSSRSTAFRARGCRRRFICSWAGWC